MPHRLKQRRLPANIVDHNRRVQILELWPRAENGIDAVQNLLVLVFHQTIAA
jgi:hypothetical protein